MADVNKKSFLIHLDTLAVLDELDDVQAGKLFKAIKSYQHNLTENNNLCTNVDNLDFVTKILFSPFKAQFDREFIKWVEKSEKNKENAQKRWKNAIPNDANAYEHIRTHTNAYDNVNDNVNVNDNDNVSDSGNNARESFLILKKDFIDVANFRKCRLYQYEELNDALKEMYTMAEWKGWIGFNDYLDKYCIFIRQIDDQIKIHEYKKLRNDYILSNRISIDDFLELLKKFNNYKPAREKYNSVYPALIGWLKKELNQE